MDKNAAIGTEEQTSTPVEECNTKNEMEGIERP